MLNRPAIFIFLISISLIIGGFWLVQNISLLPEVASSNAPIYDELFKVLFFIGTLLFVGIVGILVYSLIKFRRKPGQVGDGLPIEGNILLEIFWTAVPSIVILFVGLYSYDIYERMGGMQSLGNQAHDHQVHDHQAMTSNEKIWGGIGYESVNSSMAVDIDPLNIDLTAMQFAFLFHYPKGEIISGELHVPVGQPVSMKMESKDVIHAFWVPEFRLKQDVIPGQPTILNFTPTKPGRYPIICAELCGPYHGGMRSTVVVEEQKEYIEWFKKNAKQPEVKI